MDTNTILESLEQSPFGLPIEKIVKEEVKEVHWACKKVHCDCDEQYENYRDNLL